MFKSNEKEIREAIVAKFIKQGFTAADAEPLVQLAIKRQKEFSKLGWQHRLGLTR